MPGDEQNKSAEADNRRESVEKLFELVLQDPTVSAESDSVKQVRQGADNSDLPASLLMDSGDGADENSAMFISNLKIPQKIKLALYGNKVARGVLIKDRYRPIPLFVLQNPRLTEAEVLEFAKNSSLDQAVYRNIAQEPTWMKTYAIKVAFVSNPKVPSDISIRLVPGLQAADLRRLSRSKNIAQVVAVQCRKILENKGG